MKKFRPTRHEVSVTLDSLTRQEFLLEIQKLTALKRELISLKEENAPTPEEPFREFLMAEYNNIAHAHFNTVESLANFIKHYLLVASAPIFLLVLFADLRNLEVDHIWKVFKIDPTLAAAIGIVLYLIGMCLLGYATNIRCDTLLYARAVNGIRKYFYAIPDLSLQAELDIRVLPKSIRHPAYYEGSYFLFVVLMFAIVGTAYFGVGLSFYLSVTRNDWGHHLYALLVACFISHIILYYALTRYRDGSYLRQNIIGVDIDGVLNNHRQHFVDFLARYSNKHLDPSAITTIPVHEIPGTNVTAADEHAIFNSADYWQTMPPCAPSPKDSLDKIRNALGFRIWIFSYRPWPQGTTVPAGKADSYWSGWAKAWRLAFLQRVTGADLRRLDSVGRWLTSRGWWAPVDDGPVTSVTRKWLKASGIPCDRLVIERGNTNTPDPKAHTRNRFVMARNHRVRAFVEDDLTKAKKLANICEVVFLVDQPYNQEERLPRNVIRVRTWPEIYRHVRELF